MNFHGLCSEPGWIDFSEGDGRGIAKAQDIWRQSRIAFCQRVEDNAFHLSGSTSAQNASPARTDGKGSPKVQRWIDFSEGDGRGIAEGARYLAAEPHSVLPTR